MRRRRRRRRGRCGVHGGGIGRAPASEESGRTGAASADTWGAAASQTTALPMSGDELDQLLTRLINRLVTAVAAAPMDEQAAAEVAGGMEGGAPERSESELGDPVVDIANLGGWVKVHPEEALRGTLRRFEGRFHHIEEQLRGRGKTPDESDLAEMDALWNEAKRRLTSEVIVK